MSTLEAIQQLSDGEFHLLGDELLRRMEVRYRRLRTHGVNERGESIKGQPDSYVGETAKTCSIAVCYSVQRKSWWTKVVESIKEAIVASPSVQEIIAVVSRNVDREGPKEAIDWLADAQAAAGKASLRVVDVRDLVDLLDRNHQDIRYEHLGIPYSRLSSASILASAKSATEIALDAIRASGRYDPDRYAARSADRDLYALWQRCLEKETSGDRRVAPVRMLALVNDSGVGKTSLVCSFAKSLGAVVPVVLMQARDLSFSDEGDLVAKVVQTLQGVLAPSARALEEFAICRNLVDTVPLTVIVDGLDETHDPASVRKAITHWLRSRIGEASVLIVTSRPEFWRLCADPHWKRWMSTTAPDDRTPVRVEGQCAENRQERDYENRLPDRFTDEELEAAWTKAARAQAELYALPRTTRDELRHPFTFRAYIDLCSQQGNPPLLVDRSDLIELWLNLRLDIEAKSVKHTSREQFQSALRGIAAAIGATNTGAISVDELQDVVPRFDASNPPGEVVERLIGANILETVPAKADHIRFTVEAVQDYYRAEADIEQIKLDSKIAVDHFSKLRFTASYPRLVRIGRHLANSELRHSFVDHLAELDPRLAAVVVRIAPCLYTSGVRSRIANALGKAIVSRHRVKAAFAITMLGELDCPEARTVLETALLPPTDTHRYFKPIAAASFVKLNHSSAVEFVYRWLWFGTRADNTTYYIRDVLWMLRRANPELRQSLARFAVRDLGTPSGTKEHVKAVCVLANLGEEELVGHLRQRLAENGLLRQYENHALLAVGSDAAGTLFANSVLIVGGRLAGIPNDTEHNDERNRLIELVHHLSGDVRFLITPAFERHLADLLQNNDSTVSWIASDLIRRAQVRALLYLLAVTAAKRERWMDGGRHEERRVVDAELWIRWWKESPEIVVRKRLLWLLPLYPTTDVEEILLDCLELPDLARDAAEWLGRFGAVRAAPHLRRYLGSAIDQGSHWDKMAAADALGHLRDPLSVPLLKSVAAEQPTTLASREALMSLGFIGTHEAESALSDLLTRGIDEDEISTALVACGSASAMAAVIALAKTRPAGHKWLCERIHHLAFTRGWTSGEYYTHVDTTELVEYLRPASPSDSADDNWDFAHALSHIDSLEVREQLLTWAKRRGTCDDRVVRKEDHRQMSDLCYWQLTERGDESAIDYVLDDRADDVDETYVWVAARGLRHFPSPAVAAKVRNRLAGASTNAQAVRLLSLLGRFGDASDAELIEEFANHSDDLVANVAYESLLRLTDPLLVPNHWREI